MKKIHTTVVVVALAGAVGAAWWLQNRPSGTASGPAAAAPGASGASAAGGPGGQGGPGGAGGAGGAGGPVAVEAGKVTLARLEDAAQAVGTVRSNQSVMLRPEVSGRVVKLGFGDGQRVKRGQLLVQLDDTLQQAQVKQAEAFQLGETKKREAEAAVQEAQNRAMAKAALAQNNETLAREALTRREALAAT